MIKVTTGLVRFTFVSIYEFSQFGDFYEVNILIPKSDEEWYTKVKAAQDKALEKGKQELWNGKIPKKTHIPIGDGDDEKALTYPEYEGMWFVRAKTYFEVPVLGPDKERVHEQGFVKSGDWGRATISFMPFLNKAKGGTGLHCNLISLMKIKDGESLERGVNTDEYDDDFDANAAALADMVD